MVEGKGFGPSMSRLSAYLPEISRRQTALECPLGPFRVPIRPHFGPLRPAISGASFQLARMQREVLANLQLHSIDLCQEPGCR